LENGQPHVVWHERRFSKGSPLRIYALRAYIFPTGRETATDIDVSDLVL